MSWVLRAAPLMLNEQSNILTRGTDNQQGRPPQTEAPHRTQARRPLVPCYIGLQYGIITLKIPVVSSGVTWML